MAVHTINWLRSCAADVRKRLASAANGDAVDLLELYCGNGNHTVAMSQAFDRVTAVDINGRLVEACRENLQRNGADNVTVVRADCRKYAARSEQEGIALC